MTSDKGAVAKSARAVVEVGKIGVSAIPIFGGSIVEIINVLDDRRTRRVERFRDELLNQIGDRIADLEERLAEEPFADLLDDAIERAARTRNEAHVELIARVVAEALAGGSSSEQLEYHHMLLRLVAELLPVHLQLLIEVGTMRFDAGDVPIVPPPTVGQGSTKRRLAMRVPELADIIDPLLSDLLSAGLVATVPDDIVNAITATARGRRPMRPEEKFALTTYGKWVIQQLASLASFNSDSSPHAEPEIG